MYGRVISCSRFTGSNDGGRYGLSNAERQLQAMPQVVLVGGVTSAATVAAHPCRPLRALP